MCALWAIIHVEHAQAWGLRGGGAGAGGLRPYGSFMVYHHARQRRRYVALLRSGLGDPMQGQAKGDSLSLEAKATASFSQLMRARCLKRV